MEHVISMETSKGQDQSSVVLNETNQNQSVIVNEESPSTKVERTNAGEIRRGHDQSVDLTEDTENESVTVNEESKEIFNGWQESEAGIYLRSILQDDDWLKKNKSQNVDCPKVPLVLRNNKISKNYYDPNIVSFGPYHHGKCELQGTQTIKTKVMMSFISNYEKSIEYLYKKVHDLNGQARSCYVDGSTDDYSDKEFALMMLQDGCFILVLIEFHLVLIEFHLLNKYLDCFSIIIDHLSVLAAQHLYRDLFLLENQIPFEVLNVLMSEIYNENEVLTPTMIKSFLYRLHWGKFLKEDTREKDEKKPPHLLGLLEAVISSKRGDHVETKPENVDMGMDVTSCLQSFGSVIDLQAKGINFKLNNSISLHSAKTKKPKSISLRDIEFKSGFFNGELKLPPLIFDSETIAYYSNLMAFEMCARMGSPVTAYISFMNSLIANPEDVKVLRSKRIILHTMMSDKEVYEMLKEIFSPEWQQDFSIYQGVRQDIERHCNNKIKIWIAEMRHKYFSQAWSVISLLAAVVVIILTFLQTFYTINPRKA